MVNMSGCGQNGGCGCGLCVYQIHAIACTCTIDQSVAMLHIVHIDLVVLTASTNVMVL